MSRRSGRWVAAWVIGLGSTGCTGNGTVEVSAADAIDVVAAESQRTLDEYQRDLDALDAEREAAVASAFVQRVRESADDEASLGEHEAAFAEALGRLREDRRVSWRRHAVASDNVRVLKETATELRRLGLESMRLEDESRRYFASVLGRRQPTTGPAKP